MNIVKRDFKRSRRTFLKFFAVLFSSLGSPSWAFIPVAFFKRKNDLRVPINITLGANTQEYLLNAAVQSGYVAGKSDLTLTINTGIYVWSDNTSTAGLTCSGFATGDTLKVVNKGYIIGKGGVGGGVATAGSPGGPALDLFYSASIDNSVGYIAGGGGGGGGGGASCTGGGGAGGGSATGGVTPGGSCGNMGSNGNASNPFGGGSGGRILPGVGGNPVGIQTPGQGGGSGGSGAAQGKGSGGTSGAGGSGNSPGGNADTTNCNAAGGGGGWGATGGWGGQTISPQLYAGGLGGNAIRLNGRSVTWLGNQGNVYGVVT